MTHSICKALFFGIASATASQGFAMPTVNCGHATRGVAIGFEKAADDQVVVTFSQRFGSGSTQLADYARSLGLIDQTAWEGQLSVVVPAQHCHFSSTSLALATCSAHFVPLKLQAKSFAGVVNGEIDVDQLDTRILSIATTVAGSSGNYVLNSEEVHVTVRPAGEPARYAKVEFVPASRCTMTP